MNTEFVMIILFLACCIVTISI